MTTPVPSNQPIRYLALGDSYTIGESVPENERWSNQLAELLKSPPQLGGARFKSPSSPAPAGRPLSFGKGFRRRRSARLMIWFHY
jgi:hypothetical protein